MSSLLIYSLGGGCYVHNDIPKEHRAPSIFKGTVSSKPSYFLPLALFNGDLEREILGPSDNWNISMSFSDALKKNSLYPIILRNKIIGYEVAHLSLRTDNRLNKIPYLQELEFFKNNKHCIFFIIDFQRGGYEKYQNCLLLEFERYLDDNCYDLNNFVYLDVLSNSQMQAGIDRFNNCKIKHFINDDIDYDANEKKKDFKNTKTFLEKNIDYVFSVTRKFE